MGMYCEFQRGACLVVVPLACIQYCEVVVRLRQFRVILSEAGKYLDGVGGFFLLGDLQLEEIANAAIEALTRLKAGESGLAVHEGCGTNLATTAALSATFAWAPLRGARSTRWRLLLIPLSVAFAAFGYWLSKPLGPWLQKYITTEADLGNMQITNILFVRKGVHRIITK